MQVRPGAVGGRVGRVASLTTVAGAAASDLLTLAPAVQGACGGEHVAADYVRWARDRGDRRPGGG